MGTSLVKASCSEDGHGGIFKRFGFDMARHGFNGEMLIVETFLWRNLIVLLKLLISVAGLV